MRARSAGALTVLSAALLAAGASAAPAEGGPFRITREVVAGGGTSAEGGAFRLVGTAAQYAAAEQAGGDVRLRGGFHAPQAGASGNIFADGFEAGEAQQ